MITDEEDAEIVRTVTARDDLRREAQLPRLDIDAEIEKARKNHTRTVWINTFYPHTIIICERSRPTQINSAGWVGISNLLRLTLNTSLGEETFVQQSLDGLAARILKYDCDNWRGQILYFGAPVYLAVNYSPDRSVLYNLEREVVMTFKATIEIGYGAETIQYAKDRPGEQNLDE